ncbi:fatty acid 2-hydroxylase [Pogona vitticeps]
MTPPTRPGAYSRAQVAQGCAEGRCLVLAGRRVYDLSSFVALHPGGAEVLRERAGTDVRAALDGPPHRHSENARRWLEQYRVGWLDGPSQDGLETSTSDSYAAATTADTTDLKCKMMDADTDLVDWSKPLLWQVGHLREKYDEWIHQPVDRPIRLFQSELIESLSKTAWYMVCVVWIPVVLGFSWYSYTSLAQDETRLFSSFTTAYSIHIHKYYFPVLFIVGMCVWSFLEYLIHRFIFHMKPPASNYYLITLHFILHGQHHKAPFDDTRLVFPPIPASLVIFFLYLVSKAVFPEALGLSLFAGGLFGYVVYDMTHYYFHYGSPKPGTYLQRLKSYHVKHHFVHQKTGFGVTSLFWDHLFQTLIPEDTFQKTN